MLMILNALPGLLCDQWTHGGGNLTQFFFQWRDPRALFTIARCTSRRYSTGAWEVLVEAADVGTPETATFGILRCDPRYVANEQLCVLETEIIEHMVHKEFLRGYALVRYSDQFWKRLHAALKTMPLGIPVKDLHGREGFYLWRERLAATPQNKTQARGAAARGAR